MTRACTPPPGTNVILSGTALASIRSRDISTDVEGFHRILSPKFIIRLLITVCIGSIAVFFEIYDLRPFGDPDSVNRRRPEQLAFRKGTGVVWLVTLEIDVCAPPARC